MANMNTSDDLLRCPITMDLFHDPVVASDGHTYERQAIEQWIRSNGTSPLTRQPLSIDQLHPNRKVKELVDVFETLLREKNYQFILDVDVKKKTVRPLFQTNGKKIFAAEWLQDSTNRPEIILLKIDGARARKEASFYVNLSRHPHIIRTFGFVYDRNNTDQNNSALLLQEYARGGSLSDVLEDRRTSPGEKILIQIFLQIIEAMICLVSNHIVHGDLACRNVLVFRFDENQPEKNIVKITDFGLSRHSQLYSMISSATRTILNLVPVRYAAPEVLLSKDTSDVYTEKSDVYSMGVLMWEAYSRGALPWANIENDDDVARRVTHGHFLPQPSNCSQPFWSIITKTWSTSPNSRPTFRELKHLLNEQYYRSGFMAETKNEQNHASNEYSATGGQRRVVSRQQEDQDRTGIRKDKLSEWLKGLLVPFGPVAGAGKALSTPDEGVCIHLVELSGPPQQILQHSQQQRARASGYDERTLVIGGVANPASHFPEVAALQKIYDSHYVRGSPASQEQRSTISKKIPEFSQEKANCGGRACYKCGRCRDWRFDGPDDHWHKIRDWQNWTTDEWLVFELDHWKSYWHRRFDATCNSNLCYGAHAFILRDANDDEVASARRLFPDLFPSNKKILRLTDGFENLICVCDK
ncbi:unnamed protein product [Rotaria magnacalcarata]|uniref:Non-specific protein-tyrosine kinase n=2 Tax=Rotaria magnacalcarata TaxID=392030 RepID=A0A8S2JDB0_9BILA|nr:unnamed protein product [Rotaria magnacalcarata]CAF3843113.1 unnamed protein product [Rotaria magnacalcarata]CAF3843720.1 unnamed protein product [Rotaria magnacalcarata]